MVSHSINKVIKQMANYYDAWGATYDNEGIVTVWQLNSAAGIYKAESVEEAEKAADTINLSLKGSNLAAVFYNTIESLTVA
jgi:hypothetical protein